MSDLKLLKQAIDISKKSTMIDRYRVGAVLTNASGDIVTTGYTGELGDAWHAEEAAFEKAKQAGKDFKGGTVYSTMEPCSKRASRPKSCTQLCIEFGIARVVYGLREPDHFVICEGHSLLEEAGIQVDYIGDFQPQIEALNAHILQKNKPA